MSNLSDLYQIRTIEDFAQVARLCSEEEFETLIKEFKMCLLGVRMLDVATKGEQIEMPVFNWSPLDKFPSHLLEDMPDGYISFVVEKYDSEKG